LFQLRSLSAATAAWRIPWIHAASRMASLGMKLAGLEPATQPGRREDRTRDTLTGRS
jgi:hypothetical protein